MQIESQPGPLKVFHCYAHHDGVLRDRLETAIAGLKRDGLIISWHDRKISPGTNWQTEISTQLDSADIVLLYISPDFIESGYCVSVEMERALERQRAGRLTIVPIILRPYVWAGAPWRDFQSLPRDRKPVSRWRHQDEALQDIVQGLQRVAQEKTQGATGVTPFDAPRGPFGIERLRRRIMPLLRRSPVSAMLVVLFLSVVIQYLAYVLDIGQSESSGRWLWAALDPVYFYHLKSLSVIRRPNSFPVGLITLSPEMEGRELIDNPCVRRAFISSLLTKLAAIRPRVVVLDYFYKASSCTAPLDAGAPDLDRSIGFISGRGTRVVIGQDSASAPIIKRIIRPDLQVLTPGQIDFSRGRPNVTTGLIRLERDVQKLPLAWPLLELAKEGVLSKPVETPTLAFAAARAYRSTVDTDPVLSGMLRAEEFPLLSLSPVSDFSRISAKDVNTDVANLPDVLRNPILFIGNDDIEDDEADSSDYFETSAGKMPGVVLQANYTLSLLDGRFYAPVPVWLELALAAGFVFLVESGVRKLRASPRAALGMSLALAVAAEVIAISVLADRQKYLAAWLPLMPVFLMGYGIARRRSGPSVHPDPGSRTLQQRRPAEGPQGAGMTATHD